MNRQQMAQLLCSHGVRPTQQRLAVYEYLVGNPIHPSVDTVYEAVSVEQPTFSRTTVYNSLHALVQAGLVRELPLCSEERRYDAGLTPHAHFLCSGCGCIKDIPLAPDAVDNLLQKENGELDGCIVQGQELSFSGLCAACSTADTEAVASV